MGLGVVDEELAQTVYDGLTSFLLKKQEKMRNQEQHEDWLPYSNFSEFYEARKMLFAPAVFTDPN